MVSTKTVLVLGASTEPGRISGLAVSRLTMAGFPVVAVGKSGGSIGNVVIQPSLPALVPGTIDTVTLYLNANNQKAYYSPLLSLNPRRIIFNPGAENPELEQLAQKQGIECENACTLVLLSTDSF